jgi:hypothetical protein
MGLYNRTVGENQPADWAETHSVENHPDKNPDWRSWRFACHPMGDMLILYIEGELGSGQVAIDRMQETFDLSDTELQQLIEVWTNYIVTEGPTQADRLRGAAKFMSLMRSMERDIPQRYVTGDLKTWYYNVIGVTTPDDR